VQHDLQKWRGDRAIAAGALMAGGLLKPLGFGQSFPQVFVIRSAFPTTISLFLSHSFSW